MALFIKKIEFAVPENIDLIAKTLEYFMKSGFKQIVSNSSDKTIRFERG